MGNLADKTAYLKETRDLQQEYLKSQGKNVTNATPFRNFLNEFKALKSMEGVIKENHTTDKDTTTRTITIPGTVKKAAIIVTSFCAGGRNTIAVTPTKGKVSSYGSGYTNTTGGSYNANYRIHNDKFIFENTTGADSTLTITATNSNGYYQGMCVNVAY